MNNLLILSRKPLSEKNVALNIITHGVGGVNIDGTRIAHNEECREMTAQPQEVLDGLLFGQGGRHEKCLELKPGGRWPANLILLHRPECVFLGTVQDEVTINRWVDDAMPFGGAGGKGLDFESEVRSSSVPVYDCHKDCVALGLGTREVGDFGYERVEINRPQDYGTAARFFKQVTTMEELIDYLVTLIKPPEGEILIFDVSEAPNIFELSDASFHGAIVIGDMIPEVAQEVYRAIKPGSHVISIPSESCPTNYRNACLLEDTGFEIRDSICIPQDPNSLFYVAKPSVKEKSAGLIGKSPHPTVKPIELMERLLESVPQEETVVEPFLGSGTSGIAALRSGHSFIGFELSPEYLDVADKRIRHWDRVKEGWRITRIESDVARKKEPQHEVDWFDL